MVRQLQHIQRLYKPRLVFFIETKLDSKRMEVVPCKCEFSSGFEVSTDGSKGAFVSHGRVMCQFSFASILLILLML